MEGGGQEASQQQQGVSQQGTCPARLLHIAPPPPAALLLARPCCAVCTTTSSPMTNICLPLVLLRPPPNTHTNTHIVGILLCPELHKAVALVVVGHTVLGQVHIH